MHHIIAGTEELERGQPDRALHRFLCAYEAGHTGPDLFHHLGLAYEAMGELTLAYVAFREAVEGVTRGHSRATRQTFQESLQRVQHHWQAAAALTRSDVLAHDPIPAQIVDGFDLTTYTFVALHPAAVTATAACHGSRDYFQRAQDAYEASEVDLAVGVLQVAVNKLDAYSAKSSALYLAACTLLEARRDPERIRRYARWAVALDPDDADARALHAHVGA